MTFRTEFPDFPVADLPTLPAGFVDTSWHNDSSPSFQNEALRLHLFVDYSDVAKRELDADCRFILVRIDADGCIVDNEKSLLETDDWGEVLKFISVCTDDLDAAVLMLQDYEGIDDGGIAGMCFSGVDWPNADLEERKAALHSWLKTEGFTFRQFQATRRFSEDLGEAIGDERWNGEASTGKGNLYLDGLYIEKVLPHWPEQVRKEGGWSLLIGNQQTISDNLVALERNLYNWAHSEGYFDDK